LQREQFMVFPPWCTWVNFLSPWKQPYRERWLTPDHKEVPRK
jgi:hypothetical protein